MHNFLKTFSLVFAAELGDKTQLAALTLAATTPGARWSIFLGSALALASTSLIAVFAGEAISRIPGAGRIVRCIGGALFILFGLAIIASEARK